jgi:hypothetical protein
MREEERDILILIMNKRLNFRTTIKQKCVKEQMPRESEE